MRGKKRYLLLAAIGVAAAVLAVLWVRHRGDAGSDARAHFRFLPPGCVYALHADLAGLRSSSLARQLLLAQTPADIEKEYGEFVRATGFNFENDVRSVSVAISGPEAARVVAAVLEGRFDRPRLGAYIAARRKASLPYPEGSAGAGSSRSIEVCEGPSGRLFQIAFLNDRQLLFSNAPSPGQLRQMLDLALGGGDSFSQRLLQLGVFERVPQGSQIWLAADLERGGPLRLPVSPGSDTSFSSDLLRGGRALVVAARLEDRQSELRLAALYSGRAEAQRAADSLNSLRALLRLLAARDARAPASGPGFARALDSIVIGADSNAAVASWAVDAALLEQLLGPPRPAQ